MELNKAFESLLNEDNKRHVIEMAAFLINSLNSIEKTELTRDELNKITAAARYAVTNAKIF